MSKALWKKRASSVVYKNKWFQIREDKVIGSNGKQGEFYIVEKNPVVFIIAITPARSIYLINLFRYTTQQQSWEVPAGGSENGELPLNAARRELKEETGLEAGKWTEAGNLRYASGFSNIESYIYIAEDLEQTQNDKREEEGIDHIKIVPYKKVFEMIKNGQITSAQAIAAITIATTKLDLLK